MSRMQERAIAKELQTVAMKHPLAYAPDGGSAADYRFFRQINREQTWGLTLNR